MAALNGNRDTENAKDFLTDSNSRATAANRDRDRQGECRLTFRHCVTLPSRVRPQSAPPSLPPSHSLSPRFQSSKIAATPNPIGRNKPAPQSGKNLRGREGEEKRKRKPASLARTLAAPAMIASRYPFLSPPGILFAFVVGGAVRGVVDEAFGSLNSLY